MDVLPHPHIPSNWPLQVLSMGQLALMNIWCLTHWPLHFSGNLKVHPVSHLLTKSQPCYVVHPPNFLGEKLWFSKENKYQWKSNEHPNKWLNIESRKLFIVHLLVHGPQCQLQFLSSWWLHAPVAWSKGLDMAMVQSPTLLTCMCSLADELINLM